jgi:hypothetical protein
MNVASHYQNHMRFRREEFEAPGTVRWTCETCKNPAVDHIYLGEIQISKYKEEGYTVEICYTMRHTADLYFCIVDPPAPDNPCDEEFMEDISS